MTRRIQKLAASALLLIMCAAIAHANDANVWIKQLASDKEVDRAAAIAELRKMGESAREALIKVELNEKMEPAQLAIVRRLIGQLFVDKTELKPIDPSLLSPFGEDKEKNTPGDPNLLFNKEKKIIVMNGDFALEMGPLEFLVVTRGPNARLHETIVALLSRPRDICWALLACAYTYAGELGEDGKVNLPKDAGVMISVEFMWEAPNANLEGNPEPAAMIAAFREKCARYEKATPADRANMLLDLMSDVVFMRNMLDRDLTDDNNKLIAKNPFTDETRDEKAVADATKRKALADALQEYATKAFKPSELKQMPIVSEKKLVRLPIEFFAWNSQTNAVMKRAPFAFTGSKFEKNPETKKMVFKADEEKSIVAVKLDPYAILNTPLDTRNTDPQHDGGYGVNRYVVPRRGTKCRLVFEPWIGGELKLEDLKDTSDKKVAPAPPPAQQ
jgi:hypothetical protein